MELTGLNNRRGFMILATGLLKFARRADYPVCLLYIDLDSLKYINDTFGHAGGDAAITHFARILTDTFRDSDVIGRLGGDEFVVLMIDATESDLANMQARLQSNVDIYNLQASAGRLCLSAWVSSMLTRNPPSPWRSCSPRQMQPCININRAENAQHNDHLPNYANCW